MNFVRDFTDGAVGKQPRDWLGHLILATLGGFLGVVAFLTLIILAALVYIALAPAPAHARDNGQYAQVDPSIRDWFGSLRNQQGGQCCSFADGFSIDDPDWDVKDGRYRVRIKGEWFVVPPDAVVAGQNRIGRAVVWPYEGEDGQTIIRCFMKGTEG